MFTANTASAETLEGEGGAFQSLHGRDQHPSDTGKQGGPHIKGHLATRKEERIAGEGEGRQGMHKKILFPLPLSAELKPILPRRKEQSAHF